MEAKSQNIGSDNSRLNLIFSVNKGDKFEFQKIYFIHGDKKKYKRLRDVIASEEHKFWKVISRNKVYLNAERIELDKRLLKNYYLSKGYYNVEVVSSSAESKRENDIELTYSINAGERFRIKKLSTDIDPVFDSSTFQDLGEEFNQFAGDYYSPFKVQTVLSKIDDIVENNELQFVQHSVSETIDDD